MRSTAMKNAGGFLSLLLLSCSGATFTGIDADPTDGAADVVEDSATDTRTDVVDDDHAEYKDSASLPRWRSSRPCCCGARCKQNGNVWSCSCGPVDAPCHTGNDFECCSNSCVAGWCK